MTFVETVELSGAAAAKRKAYLGTLSVFFVFIILFTTTQLANWPVRTPSAPLVDFDDFYLAGLLSAAGNIGRAYHLEDLVAAQKAVFGVFSFLPWTYPPQYDLLTAPFSLLPRGLAYLTF